MYNSIERDIITWADGDDREGEDDGRGGTTRATGRPRTLETADGEGDVDGGDTRTFTL